MNLYEARIEAIKKAGLYEKVKKNGIRSLSAKESGRVGGIMSGILRKNRGEK